MEVETVKIRRYSCRKVETGDLGSRLWGRTLGDRREGNEECTRSLAQDFVRTIRGEGR
jgi:hypothetical protein